MFKTLRRKFVIIAVSTVFAVLTVILGSINLVNYRTVIRNADLLLAVLAEGGGTFVGRPSPGVDLSPETPFSTRYFTVVLDESGNAVQVNLDRIVSVTTVAQACAMAVQLSEKGRTSGFFGNFRYGTCEISANQTMYLFVDCTRELEGFRDFLWTSVAIGFLGLAVVSALIFVLSGRMLRPVAESAEKQKQFITDASHEIKTPLTIIGANTQILELQTGENEWTQGIREQIERLTALTKKLLFLSRLEEGNHITMTEYCISDAIEESLQPFAAVAEAKGMTLVLNIRPRLSHCGNEELIRQLASLLVDNALKYSDGGEVSAELQEERGHLRFSVRNRASDLPDGTLNHLFERFRRGDSSRNSETGGHGIGLSVAQKIVSAHGGKISAVCKDGTVCFSVLL